jgi:hypothetical protein
MFAEIAYLDNHLNYLYDMDIEHKYRLKGAVVVVVVS